MWTKKEVRTGETGGKRGKLKDQGCGRVVNIIASSFTNLFSATLIEDVMRSRNDMKENS